MNEEKVVIVGEAMGQPKRPMLVSIISVIGILLSSLSVYSFLFNPIMRKISEQFGSLYILVTVAITLANIVAFVGFWKMKKWGVYSYIIIAFVSLLFGLYFTKGIAVPTILGLIFPAIVITIGLINIKKMK